MSILQLRFEFGSVLLVAVFHIHSLSLIGFVLVSLVKTHMTGEAKEQKVYFKLLTSAWITRILCHTSFLNPVN